MVAQAAQQRVVRDQLHFGMAEFACVGRFRRATQLRGQGLHAVADAEDRQAAVEHLLRRFRRTVLGGGLRSARQDDALRAELRDLLRIVVPRPDFAVDADLADAAGNQLRVLRAEIEDEDLVGMDVGHERGVSAEE